VRNACGFRRARHRGRLLEFALGRKVLPEVRDQEGAVGAREGALEARRVVGVAGHDLRARRG
jgi:hypothetical protein